MFNESTTKHLNDFLCARMRTLFFRNGVSVHSAFVSSHSFTDRFTRKREDEGGFI